MKPRFMKLPLAATLFIVATLAEAGACNDPPAVSSTGFNISNYDPMIGSTTSISTTLTGNCTKTGGNTDTYTVGAGQGLNFSVGSNRANSGANFINYAVTKDVGCGTIWNGTNTYLFSFTSSGSLSPTYYGCVQAGQYVAALTYADTVTMTTNHGGLLSTNTFPVSITVATRCTVSSAPGAIAFAYTAFGAAVTANTTVGIICNPSLPYSADVGGGVTGSGVVSGLNYSLGINTSGTGGTNPLSATGIGTAQTFFINGSMAAGQAGTCASGSCPATDPRTLTITY